MRRALAPLACVIALLLGALGTLVAVSPVHAVTVPSSVDPEDPNPPGANDFTCKPSAAHPEPVVIVHGTFGDRKHLLEKLSAAIKAAGYCVYSLDYGNRATQDISTSAKELGRFVHRVLVATGATKVEMVGHSQGGMMPRYWIKFLGGGRLVDDLVGLSPSNHGTVILGDPSNPITGPLGHAECAACQQQRAGSPFLTHLNAGDETPGQVSYTQISTTHDEVVVPYTSAFLKPGSATTNITIQDYCSIDTADHVGIPSSVTAIAFVLDAFSHPGPARTTLKPPCSLTVPQL